jgi:hypothetical protein
MLFSLRLLLFPGNELTSQFYPTYRQNRMDDFKWIADLKWVNPFDLHP